MRKLMLAVLIAAMSILTMYAVNAIEPVLPGYSTLYPPEGPTTEWVDIYHQYEFSESPGDPPTYYDTLRVHTPPKQTSGGPPEWYVVNTHYSLGVFDEEFGSFIPYNTTLYVVRVYYNDLENMRTVLVSEYYLMSEQDLWIWLGFIIA